MIFIKIVLVWVSTFLVQNVIGEPPNFRILAPPFVCPTDEDALIQKPAHTIITMQTKPDIDVDFHWIVRWHPLVAPTQRDTLALWKISRHLESKLDMPQLENHVFVINHSELMPGVTYIFNVTAMIYLETVGTEQMFEIDYSQKDPKLLIEGQSEMFAIFLMGVQRSYADIDFILEAQVTECYGTQDYYFVWTLTTGANNVTVSDVKGSWLVIRPNTLTPGQSYDVLCQVYKLSNGDFLTQNSMPFRMLHRNLSVNFNVNMLVISALTPFKLYTDINKQEFLNNEMSVVWECTLNGEAIEPYYVTDGAGTLSFPNGLFHVGEYLITVRVLVLGQTIEDQVKVRVNALEPRLPVIQMFQMSRILNEGNEATFKANISNVVPGCSIIWYFRSQHCLVSVFSSSTDICADNEHGTRISEPINFYSLEENFLSELTDYTNETTWRTVSANMNPRAGRVRLVVDCHCVKEDNCTSDGEVHADVIFLLNTRPFAREVSTTPMKGTAMETQFRVRTYPNKDTTRPLRYSFFVDLTNNDTLLLGSYLENTAILTLLPYVEAGTYLWVEVCDSLGACSKGAKTLASVAPGEARTMEALLEDARGHVRRCELMLLRRLAASAIVTYTNVDQAEALSKFTTSLLTALEGIEERCVENNYDQYNEFIYWLQTAGIDTTKLL